MRPLGIGNERQFLHGGPGLFRHQLEMPGRFGVRLEHVEIVPDMRRAEQEGHRECSCARNR